MIAAIGVAGMNGRNVPLVAKELRLEHVNVTVHPVLLKTSVHVSVSPPNVSHATFHPAKTVSVIIKEYV